MRILPLGVALTCLASPLVSLAAQDEHAGSHAGLGIFLENHGTDSGGVRIRGVMPQGPAAKAGLEEGDVILRFNGTTVDKAPKLMELAHRLQPGDTVKVDYRREGQTHTATVVAERMGQRFAMMFRRMPGGADFGLHAGPNMMFFHSHHAPGLALVPMSRDLGEYFGTSDGLLVVKPPPDSTSPLKAGDVILAIDGRKPQSVEHAHRILGSYAPGEKAKLEVMRKRQRTTLTWTAPERRDGREGQDGHFGPGRRFGMDPEDLDDQLDSWGAMDFELPAPPEPPDMDFMLQVPSTVEAQET